MRLLTLNGGGTAGFAACLILQKLEHETGEPCYKLFDLIHGVSTGAIITGALGIGMPADDLVEFYRREIPIIFKKLHWPFWRWYIGPAKYNAEALEEVLTQVFGDTRFNQTHTSCMIHALQISPRVQPYFWKSWFIDYTAPKIADIIRASSAAPTYFSSKQIGARTFVDGGLCANNPSHCTIIEAMRLGVPTEDISVVNIQLGDSPHYSQEEVAKWRSIARWAPKLTDVLLSANVEVGEYLASHLIDHYINVDFNLTDPLDHWSDEFQLKCHQVVNQYWAVHGKRIVAQVLNGKKTTPASFLKMNLTPSLENDPSAKGSNGDNQLNPYAHH